MVKFYESSFSYNYSFPAVTLAYFLRYPNPYSTHVLSTDVISRYTDAHDRLHTVRIHRKRTRLPAAVLNFLPQSVLASLGNKSVGTGSEKIREQSGESYVLETSIVDIKEGWMRTESKNLDWTSILSVVEKQEYRRHKLSDRINNDDLSVTAGTTGVLTTVTFRSNLGSRLRAKTIRVTDEIAVNNSAEVEEEQPRKSLLASWSAGGIQKSIEVIASRRTENQLGKSRDGMLVVLERLRLGGLMAVSEGMRKDRDTALTSII